MAGYEFIDHTADIGIRVFADDLKGIFITAAGAMFEVVAARPGSLRGLDKKIIRISLKAANQEELLIRWLSELLSLSDCEDVFFVDFQIKEITENALEANAEGFSRRAFAGKREIKAVTYHGLKISEEKGRYKAEIIFDV